MDQLPALTPRPAYVRATGVFLLASALATAISVPARLVADADQPTLAESLGAIALNKDAYIIAGWARDLSGLALEAAVLCLLRSRWGQFSFTLIGACIVLGFSGLATTLSGFCSLTLARHAPEAGASGALFASVAEQLQIWDDARWILGKTGFFLAGLGMMVLGPFLWRMGGMMKVAGAVGAAIGFTMLFIWMDASTIMHRISGIAFLLCLIGSGVWLWGWNAETTEREEAIRRG